MAQYDAIRVLAEMLGAGQSAACGEQGAARNMMVDFFPMVTKWGYRILHCLHYEFELELELAGVCAG
jgi:hypothetical protein